MRNITQHDLQQLFEYSVITGKLYSKVDRGAGRNRIKAGEEIVCNRLFHSDGKPMYAQLYVNGQMRYFHRVIWFLVTGYLPDRVDHRDLDICNNAWLNLRDSNASENGCNRTKQLNNKSGYKGVSWCKRQNLWRSQIQHLGKSYYLGKYETIEKARDVYNAKAQELHLEFAQFKKD